jgi:membrane protease subunit HflK
LAEYQKAPRVTRDRLYIEAIEQVYSRSAKVIIDTDGSGNLMYLPLDKLLNRSGIDLPDASANRSSSSLGTSSRSAEADDPESGRERGTRQ